MRGFWYDRTWILIICRENRSCFSWFFNCFNVLLTIFLTIDCFNKFATPQFTTKIFLSLDFQFFIQSLCFYLVILPILFFPSRVHHWHSFFFHPRIHWTQNNKINRDCSIYHPINYNLSYQYCQYKKRMIKLQKYGDWCFFT